MFGMLGELDKKEASQARNKAPFFGRRSPIIDSFRAFKASYLAAMRKKKRPFARRLSRKRSWSLS
jgi:hypothetical protein